MKYLKFETEIVSKPVIATTHCVGCHKEVNAAWTRRGKIWQGTVFIKVPIGETELEYDSNFKLVSEVEVIETKTVPIGKWASGDICSDCQGDYRTIPRYRKDGSQWFEPVVKLEPIKVQTVNAIGKRVLKPSSEVPVNPGWSVQDERNMEHEYDGWELVEPYLDHKEIDLKCYHKFARGR